jgi:NAD(P)-binding Rossmann-like domain
MTGYRLLCTGVFAGASPLALCSPAHRPATLTALERPMKQIETDYLVIGAGTAGLAFADSLLDHGDAHITIVDRHGKPGGHWNDAYSFVTLHQPSAFYGVNSTELGSRGKDVMGPNKGMYELASGPEVVGYFDRVMNQRLLPSGRVGYHPVCNYLGEEAGVHRFESALSGEQTQVVVRKKLVDATYYSPSVPSTHTPKFKVADGARLVPPNALPHLGHGPTAAKLPKQYVIVGAGKTAMDAGVWLINAGAKPDAIHWVMPRDSWLVNRVTTQPGPEFFDEAIGGQAKQMEAFAKATDTADLFARMEACGALLRIHTDHTPSMFHLATITPGEIEILRRIKNVIRLGRVNAIESDALILDQGRVALNAADTLYIDCTASAVEARKDQPIFQGNKIVLQLVRLPQPAFSAALVAYVEAHYDADSKKNQLCGTVPFPHSLEDYPKSIVANMWNQFNWGQDKALRAWIRESRLDGFTRLMSGIAPDDTHKQATVARLRENAMAAMANLPKVIAASMK